MTSETLSEGKNIQVLVDVENSGERAGVEIVQVYLSDLITSATWLNKALKSFAGLTLAAGEKKDCSGRVVLGALPDRKCPGRKWGRTGRV